MFAKIKNLRSGANTLPTPTAAAVALKKQGDAYLGQENYEQALSHYQQALNITPSYIDALIGAGFANIEKDTIDEAQPYLQQVLSHIPNHADAHFMLGNIAKQKADSKKAIEHYLRAININPQFQFAYRALFKVYRELGNELQAKLLLERAIQALPSSSDFLFERAGLYFADKDYVRAISLLQKAIMLSPDNMAYRLNIANVYICVENYEAAVPHLEWIVQTNPNNIDAQQDLANSYLKLNKKQEALACFKEVLRLEPDSPVKHLVAAFSGQTTDTAPTGYIKNLFDGYAEKFESHLTQALHYDVPARMVTMLQFYRDLGAQQPNVLDLGCGTGLFGKNIAPFAKSLVGVDLSQKMLEKAALLNVYQRLECQELLAMMQQEPDASYDLIAACDVFVYIGALDALVHEVKRVLRPKGIFAFSTESLAQADSSAPFVLNESGRYAHALSYLTGLAQQNGFTVLANQQDVIRENEGKPIAGHLCIWTL